jgi:DNA-binding PadR family transcriptional regulator
MFRRFGYQFEGVGDSSSWGGDWTPPWMQERHQRHHGPGAPLHFAMRRMRGGPFGGPFGPRGGFGPGEGGRFFGRGDMKFALLELLRERPMYGYEMMKALEEKSGGFYSPSPGSIYPTLQMLEERNFVSAAEVDGKKVYSITDTGRALLDEHQKEEFSGPPWMRHHHAREEQRQHLRARAAELQALRSESMEVARLFAIAGRGAISDPEKLARLRAVIESTRKELTELIYGDTSSTQETPGTPPSAE